jgi:hypothetical protein
MLLEHSYWVLSRGGFLAYMQIVIHRGSTHNQGLVGVDGHSGRAGLPSYRETRSDNWMEQMSYFSLLHSLRHSLCYFIGSLRKETSLCMYVCMSLSSRCGGKWAEGKMLSCHRLCFSSALQVIRYSSLHRSSQMHGCGSSRR